MEYMIIKKQREMKENCIRKSLSLAKSATAIAALYLVIFDELDSANTELKVNAAVEDYYKLNRLVNKAISKKLIEK